MSDTKIGDLAAADLLRRDFAAAERNAQLTLLSGGQ